MNTQNTVWNKQNRIGRNGAWETGGWQTVGTIVIAITLCQHPASLQDSYKTDNSDWFPSVLQNSARERTGTFTPYGQRTDRRQCHHSGWPLCASRGASWCRPSGSSGPDFFAGCVGVGPRVPVFSIGQRPFFCLPAYHRVRPKPALD
jgi:hypothetical protein